MSARVLVVEHEADAGIGLVGDVMRGNGVDVVIVGPETGHAIPADLAGFDGIVVLGGTPGPTDDDVAAWLPGVRALVAQALERRVPYLGICLGAQILAVVAGGVVDEATRPEVGVHGLEVTDEGAHDPLLGGLPAALQALQWHFLEVVELPAASRSLCRSERCANQAFRVGEVAWGLQFHLEADAATARRWAKSGDESAALRRLGLRADDVIATMAEQEDAVHRVWSEVAARWTAVVQQRASAPASSVDGASVGTT